MEHTVRFELPEAEAGAHAAAAPEDALWYKDAVIYQLHVKAFFDSDDDGIGDFRGLTSKLDYIKDLGVDTIWLMPFYPSPLQGRRLRRRRLPQRASAVRDAPRFPALRRARRTGSACE